MSFFTKHGLGSGPVIVINNESHLMKLNYLTALAAFFLVCGGGFMVGRWSATAVVRPADPASVPRAPSRSASISANQEESGTARKASRSGGETNPKGSLDQIKSKLAGLLRDENPLDRHRALLALVDRLNPAEFREAVEVLKGLGLTEDRGAELAVILTAWTLADPLAAMAYAKESEDNESAQNTILTAWATKDPEAAIRWATANFKGDGANPYLAGIIRGIAQTDPKRAASLLTGMPRSNERGEALDYMLPHYFAQGTDAARNWIASLKDDSLRNGAIERAAEKLAEGNPAATAAWLMTQPGKASQQQMDDVYGIWAKTDKQAALTSFGTLPTGEIRTNALRGIVNQMASKDAKEAIRLMDRFPTDVTDRVVQSFIWHSARSDTAAAASQIARLKDEGRRDQMYRRLLDNWLDYDPTAAKTWMANNAIPDAVRTDLNNR
jgi:hypothetical protein